MYKGLMYERRCWYRYLGFVRSIGSISLSGELCLDTSSGLNVTSEF
jgi:hypothetical protein